MQHYYKSGQRDSALLKNSQRLNKQPFDPYEKIGNHLSDSHHQSTEKGLGSRILQNSRKKDEFMNKASKLFQSSNVKSRPQSAVKNRSKKSNEVMEFNNLKWISIISAYNSSRLKNVLASKKSCQKFLKLEGSNMKNDPRSQLYFNDLIKNYKSWLHKIYAQYVYIMNRFLNSKNSVNVTLSSLRPKIDEVIWETQRMENHLSECLGSFENHEMRALLKKYLVALDKSKEIEEIILVVNRSKNKIDDLFQKFDNDDKLEKKIVKVKNEGIHQVREIVCSHGEVGLEAMIMDKIQTAINEMAQKSGEAYRKIRSIKNLIEKFKQTEFKSEDLSNVDIDSINLMSRVCRQICIESEAFEAFADKFLEEGEFVNDDLKKVITRYSEDMLQQRRKAIDLQMKFLSIILNQTIEKLKQNTQISAVYEHSDQNHEEYRTILRMLQDICDCLIDENPKYHLSKLIKDSRVIFDRLYDELRFIKENKHFLDIDTEEGLISVLEVGKLLKEYKDKILSVRKKFQHTHRDLHLQGRRADPVLKDEEIQFIEKVIKLSKAINNSELKGRIREAEPFVSISGHSLSKLSQQLQDQKVIKELKTISREFFELSKSNVLEKHFGNLSLEHLLFKECGFLDELKKLTDQTKEQNLIAQLQLITQQRSQWIENHPKISRQFKRFYDRVLCRVLVKGLKAQDIKQIQNSNLIKFPEAISNVETLKSKIKYRQLLLGQIENPSQPSDNFQLSHSNVRKIYESSKAETNATQFVAGSFLNQNISAMKNLITAYDTVQNLLQNKNHESYLEAEWLVANCRDMFKLVFIDNSSADQTLGSLSEVQAKAQTILTEVSNAANRQILALSRKLIEVQNTQTNSPDLASSSINGSIGKQFPVHLQKIIDVLKNYKQLATDLKEKCQNCISSIAEETADKKNTQQELKDHTILKMYSQVILNVSVYIKKTNQEAYFILNAQKSPIAIVDGEKGVFHDLFKGMNSGKLCKETQCEWKVASVGISLKSRAKKIQKDGKVNKDSQKRKAKINQMMDQEIQEDENYEEDFPVEDQLPADEISEQERYDMEEDFEAAEEIMADEQIGDQAVEQIEDQMGGSVEDQAQQIEDMLEEDDIAVSKKQISNRDRQKKTQNKSRSVDEFQQWDLDDDNAKKQKGPRKQKADSKGKHEQEMAGRRRQPEEEPAVFHKKLIEASVFQSFSFISTLFQLRAFIGSSKDFSERFIKNKVQWAQVAHFFNYHSDSRLQESVSKYMKSLQNLVEKAISEECKGKTHSGPFKTLETVRELNRSMLLLQNGNWAHLVELLKVHSITFNLLCSADSNNSGRAGEPLFIEISDPLKYQKSQNKNWSILCVDGFLHKMCTYYSFEQFQMQKFTEKCLFSERQEQHSSSITYWPKHSHTIPVTEHQKSQKQKQLQQLKNTLSLCQSPPQDQNSKFELCLALWRKSLGFEGQSQQGNFTFDFSWFKQILQKLRNNKQSSFIYYVQKIGEQCQVSAKKVNKIMSRLENVEFKCNKSNIFECIGEVGEIYQGAISSKWYYVDSDRQRLSIFVDRQNEEKAKQSIERALTSNRQEHFINRLIVQTLIGSGNQRISNPSNPDEVTSSNIFIKKEEIIKRVQNLIENRPLVGENFQYLLKMTQILEVSTIHMKIITDIHAKTSQYILEDEIEKLVQIFIRKQKQAVKEQCKSQGIDLNKYQALRSLLTDQADSQQWLQKQISEFFTIKQHTATSSEATVPPEYFVQSESAHFLRLYKSITSQTQTLKRKLCSGLSKGELSPCEFTYLKFINPSHSKQDFERQSEAWYEQLDLLDQVANQFKEMNSIKHWLSRDKGLKGELEKDKLFIKEGLKRISEVVNMPEAESSKQFTDISKSLVNSHQWVSEICCDTSNKVKILSVYLDIEGEVHLCYYALQEEEMTFQLFERFWQKMLGEGPLTSFLWKFIEESLVQVEDKSNIPTLSGNSLQNSEDHIVMMINGDQVCRDANQFIKQISEEEFQTQRKRSIKDFVRQYNKLHFICNTTKDIDYKQQLKHLVTLQQQLRTVFAKLGTVYDLRGLMEGFINSKSWNKSRPLENLSSSIRESTKNEKLKPQNLQKIQLKLTEIGISPSLKTFPSSYSKFYSWFYLTAMFKDSLQYGFYNLVTHSREILTASQSKESEATYTDFLGVIMTEQAFELVNTDHDQELQECLTEILPTHQHKPVYLKEGDLTVQLLKESAYVKLPPQSQNQSSFAVMMDYLSDNRYGFSSSEKYEELYLRIDQMSEKGEVIPELTQVHLLKAIDWPLEVSLEVNKDMLNVDLEVNVIQANPEEVTNSWSVRHSPVVTGRYFESYKQVYIGKTLELKNIYRWVQDKYQQVKSQQETKKKQEQLKRQRQEHERARTQEAEKQQKANNRLEHQLPGEDDQQRMNKQQGSNAHKQSEAKNQKVEGEAGQRKLEQEKQVDPKPDSKDEEAYEEDYESDF